MLSDWQPLEFTTMEYRDTATHIVGGACVDLGLRVNTSLALSLPPTSTSVHGPIATPLLPLPQSLSGLRVKG